MIKKILAILILGLTFLLSVNYSLAQEVNKESQSTPSAEKATVDYTLPYPGLLPDHPFYFLKTTRDALVGFFISDPLKKADFNLLQADKRLNTGIYLIAKGKEKEQMAITAISKGENYFEKSIEEIIKAEKQGTEINDLLGKMLLSSKKHQEILIELKSKVSKDAKAGIENELKRVQKIEQMVSEIKAK